MKRIQFAIFTLSVIPMFAQTAYRVDPIPAFTVATNTPPGAYTPVLAIPGATVSVNGTTYTDTSATTVCPSNAPVNPAGTTACVSTTNAQGAFGFWLLPGNYQYSISTIGGTFGPYPLSVAGGGGGGGSGSSVGPVGAVQVAGAAGTFYGSTALTFASGYLVSNGGFVSNANSWQGINSLTDGSLLRGYAVGANAANTAGGYLALAPVTYHPHLGAACTDQWGNPVQQPLPLSGLGGFGTNDAIIWVAQSASMPASGCGAEIPVQLDWGLMTNSYWFARGGFATDVAAYNSFQSLLGGYYAKLGYTADQALYLQNHATTGTLNNPASGYGALAHKQGSQYYYYNDTGSAWHVFDFAAAAGTMQDCVGTPGNTVGGYNTLCQDATHKVYACGNAAGCTLAADWANVGQSGVSGVASFNTRTGAVSLTSLDVTNALTFTPEPALGNPGTSGFALVSTTAGVRSWAAIGSGCPANPVNSVQYNAAGNCAGSANFTYGSNLLTLVGPGVSSPGLTLSSGYMQADGGFWTSNVNTDAIHANSGGITAKWHIATDSVFWIEEATPAISATGQSKIYMDNSTHRLRVSQNGAAPVDLVGGSTSSGVTSLNSLTGALSILGTGSQVNVTPSGSWITLSLPQSIGTSNTPQFAAVIASGAFNSFASGSSTAFQANGGAFQVDGYGDISSGGSINAAGNSTLGLAPYRVNGTAVIDNGRNLVNMVNGTFTGQITTYTGLTSGGGIQAAGYNVTGGYLGQTWDLCFATTFTINGAGSYSCIVSRGGIIVSARED